MRLAKAAALCCGLFLSAPALPAQDSPHGPGPVPSSSVSRLLLIDGARAGGRLVVVGDRGYILLSDDQGASWRRAKSPKAPMLTAVRFADDRNGWAVGHDSVILHTADGGESWKNVATNPPELLPLLDIALVEGGQGIVVGAYGTYFESSDGGATWKDRKIVADDKHYNGILQLKDGRLMILGEAGTILVSADRGQRWTALPSPYNGSFFGGVVADDGAIVAYGLRGRIYRSADGGKSWAQVANATQASIMGGTRLPDGAIVLAGAAGTALVSRDNGLSFQPIETGTTRAFSRAIAAGPDKVLLLGEAGVRAVELPTVRKRQP